MRLASDYDRILAAGCEIVAVSVDSDERNAALAKRWDLPFLFLSDPGGEQLLQPRVLYNPDERDGLAIPAIALWSPEGHEAYRVISRDFADRLHDEDVIQALEALDWPAIDRPAPWVPSVEAAEEPVKGAFQQAMYRPYFSGNRFGAVALSRRFTDDAAIAEAKAHEAMSISFLEAFEAHLKN